MARSLYRPPGAGRPAAAIANVERDVLTTLLCQGMSLTEAGRSLNLNEETARNYSKRIYAKTGTRSQTEPGRRGLRRWLNMGRGQAMF